MIVSKFQKLAKNPFLFRLYLLKNLPLAYLTGIRIEELTASQATTTIKLSWITKNPFHSIYFACELMAVELSTAMILLDNCYESTAPISTLIIENKAVFFKKAKGKIRFICKNEAPISELIHKTQGTGEAVLVDLKSIGVDEAGDKVAEFIFTWSIKAKTNSY